MVIENYENFLHISVTELLYVIQWSHAGYAEMQKVLKEAVIRAGVEEKATVVVVDDAVLYHPTILHLLNTLILTGDAPNLLSPEDHSYLLEVSFEIQCNH